MLINQDVNNSVDLVGTELLPSQQIM